MTLPMYVILSWAALLLVLLVQVPIVYAEPNYQGTYASDCSKQKEASITISAREVVLRTPTGVHKLKRIDIPAGNYVPAKPAPDFVKLLLAEDGSRKSANVEVFASNGATAIRMSGDPDIQSWLPPSLRQNRVPRCETKPGASTRKSK